MVRATRISFVSVHFPGAHSPEAPVPETEHCGANLNDHVPREPGIVHDCNLPRDPKTGFKKEPHAGNGRGGIPFSARVHIRPLFRRGSVHITGSPRHGSATDGVGHLIFIDMDGDEVTAIILSIADASAPVHE